MRKRKKQYELPTRDDAGLKSTEPSPLYVERSLADDIKEDLKFARMRVKELSQILIEVQSNPDAERIIKLYRRR